MDYYVRDSTGHDYSVGTWVDGRWRPGTREDAIRECFLLAEPGSYVWGKR